MEVWISKTVGECRARYIDKGAAQGEFQISAGGLGKFPFRLQLNTRLFILGQDSMRLIKDTVELGV